MHGTIGLEGAKAGRALAAQGGWPGPGRARAAPRDAAPMPPPSPARPAPADTLEMVRDALAAKRGLLAFQPVVSAARPGRAAFHEGLIRITDAEGRIIPAGEFMGAVEDNELGRRIDCLALDLGLRELAAQPGLRLAINMSARSVGYREWGRTLDAGLEADPTAAERLILEITESSAIAMPELVIAFMEEMQGRGITFALDDFGAGYTSFRYLRDFFFDILKIDGQFVRGIADDPDNQALVRALVAVARHFEMFTVAESVERREDVAVLTEIGVDCLQGYHFGAPVISPAWRGSEARAAG